MADVKKIPYYQPKKDVFGSELVEFKGSKGCVPLETQRSVSIDRLAPGETPPPPPPKPVEKQPPPEKKAPEPVKGDQPKEKPASAPKDSEVCENPPPFDLQDVPIAMDNLGWKVSAQLARMWFAWPVHVYNDDAKSVQPIVGNVVTLDWALKFGNIKDKYDALLSEGIYRNNAVALAQKKINDHIGKRFAGNNATSLSFSTTSFLGDLRQFHIDWQFQMASISDWDTLDHLAPNDLTGALANFGIYVAIGTVEVSAEKYFKRVGEASASCIDASAQVTHVYAYIKDNYSFNGEQYLGHWNKNGVIIAPGGFLSDSDSAREDSGFDIWIKSVNKPVDTRKGFFGKFKPGDAYFPVYNATYNSWRMRHHMGGDFMIYSKPVYLKLRNPIDIKIGEICAQESGTSLVP